MRSCLAVDLGVIAYERALEWQRRLVEGRKTGATPDVLLLCEHPPVITLGRNGRREHLRVSEPLLRRMGIEFHVTDRGGDITYHGPGQQVGYPILNVGELRRDVGWYVRQLEEALIRAAGDFGVSARREPGLTGVWVQRPGCLRTEKLAAIGVHFSRWISSHGFACNVATDLRNFDLIVPCGIADRGVTSLERLLGRRIGLGEFQPRLIERFGEVYDLTMQPASPELLESLLGMAAPAPLAAGS